MSKKFVYMSDFSAAEIPTGGGEINDKELIDILRSRNHKVKEFRTRDVTPEKIKELSGNLFIVSNFILLTEASKKELQQEKYVIYEHDHKYLASRDPAKYKDYRAPHRDIINRDFYKNAIAVFCQTSFHSKILKTNLMIENVVSLGGNLWSLESLELIKTLSEVDGEPTAAIMDSTTPHKNTVGAIELCQAKEKEFNLVSSTSPKEFLEKLSKNQSLVFLPQTPETCSRLLVEARMLGLGIITNGKSGAVHEEWFKLKGKELISVMEAKREEIADTVELSFEKEIQNFYPEIKNKDFKISLITSLYNGDKHLKGFLDNITSQTIFEKCELIIINANSPGNEEAMIKEYMKKFPNIIYKKLNKDPGIYGCWDMGIQMSTGNFISNANLDDRRSIQQLEIMAEELIRNEEIDLVYSECLVTNSENETYSKNTSMGQIYPSQEFSNENMIKCLPGPMPLWRRSMHDSAGEFDSSYKFAGDWDMWLRAVKTGSKFKKVFGSYGLYHNNPQGLTTDVSKSEQKFSEEKKVFLENSDVFGEKVYNEYKGYFSQ
jgi:hypothetical protein